MDDQTAPKQDSEQPDTAPPPNVTKPPNTETASPATAQQLAEVEEHMSGFERATLRWAKSAVIMSGLAAIFVCAQWYEMHEGGVDTHALAVAAAQQAEAAGDMATAVGDQVDAGNNFADSAEEINRGVTGAVDQLKAAATNANASIDATKEVMRLDQRAWLGVENVTGQPTVGELFIPATHIKNTGKTPAKDALIFAVAKPFLRGSHITFDYQPVATTDESKAMIAPNSTRSMATKAPESVMDDPTLKLLKSGDIVVYVYGKGTYRDVFGCGHWLTYCFYLMSDAKSWTDCNQYNDTGDDKCSPSQAARR